MKQIKSHKYRLDPTKEQKVLLNKHLGCKRFIYNFFLNKRKLAYTENNEKLNYYDLSKNLALMKKMEEYKWLGEVNSQSIQASLRDLDVAYNNFFYKKGGFPNFKAKQEKQTFKIPQHTIYKDKLLNIPKFKEPIKVIEDRPLPENAEILFSTITKTSTKKYFISITFEAEHKIFPKNENKVGIDVGIKSLATLSDGTVYENLKNTKKYEKKLAFEQKMLAKKVKGSNNRNIQKLRVAQIYEDIRNHRMDHIHKITTEIINNNNIICVETLAVANMLKNHKLSKSISDCAWGEFFRQLDYKAKWNEREIAKIDRFFPSSKMCNKCKYINKNLELKDRTWVCPKCGAVLDRDKNASENILEQGLLIYLGKSVPEYEFENFESNLYEMKEVQKDKKQSSKRKDKKKSVKDSGCGTQSDVKQKRGEALPLGGSLKRETQKSSASE